MATHSGGFFEFNKLKLPKIGHVIEFVTSRTDRSLGAAKLNKSNAVAEMVNQVHSIWVKAYHPPKTKKSMRKMFSNLTLTRKKLQKKKKKHELRKLDNEVWDVLADQTLREGLMFDIEFYKEQKSNWESQMEVTVNPEFNVQVEKEKTRTDKKIRRKKIQYSDAQLASNSEINLAIYKVELK